MDNRTKNPSHLKRPWKREKLIAYHIEKAARYEKTWKKQKSEVSQELHKNLSLMHRDYAQEAAMMANILEQMPSWKEFYDEVCRRAEQKMLRTGKLEGMHYAALKEYHDELLAKERANAH